MVALVVFTDGRWGYLEQTVASAAVQLDGTITHVILVVDGGLRVGPREWGPVSTAFPDAHLLVMAHRERLGFGGTIRAAWEALAAVEVDYVFHLEDDFTFNRPVDLDAMAHVLRERPHLAQLALRRQPWSEQERRAGGVVEVWPDEYEERTAADITDIGDGVAVVKEHAWLEHRLFWTTNPSLYRRELCAVGWPDGPHSEQVFTRRLLADGLPWDAHGVPITGEALRFGYWGARDSGEAVHHIGMDRSGGTGY